MNLYKFRTKLYDCFSILFILCAALLYSANNACAAQAQSTDSSRTAYADFEYTIGLGDILEVQVWKEPELSRSNVQVRIDGQLSLPLLGDVNAAGKSIKDLTHYLEKKYGEVVNEPAVSVMLQENRSWRYYIVGQIAQPGEFTLDYPITLLQAIARSGGFLEWAKKSDIKVLRKKSGQEEILTLDYEDLVKGKNLKQNLLILPGDTIIVP